MLQEQDVEALRARKAGHSGILRATENYWEGGLDAEELSVLTSALADVPLPEDMTWVLYGYGSQTASCYRELGNTSGVDVLWTARFGPWWLFPLTLLAASHGGLLRLDDRKQLAPTFSSSAAALFTSPSFDPNTGRRRVF